jgi:lysophospholipase L1-like esterase
MIRPGKRTLFVAVTALAPVVVLVVLEFTLRTAGAFERLPVVFDLPGSGGEIRAFNSLVAGRYVDPRRTTVPMLTPETFRAVKTPDILRILCLGESTTAGFPFDGQVPFPVQLRQRLSEAYPGKRVEVLNAGIAAIGSYVVVDMLPELLDTQPDVIVVYMGHNEFYGIYGSGSAFVEGGSDFFVRGALAVQRTAIGRMMKRGLELLSKTPETDASRTTLMQQAVRDRDIPLGSKQYRTTMENLERNLDRLLSGCANRGVPVILSSLVSNDRDLRPFRPVVDSTRIASATARMLIARGDSLRREQRWDDAARSYGDLLRADSGNADAWFGMGRCSLALGRPDEARRWLDGARDHDAMRFRASGEANVVLRRAAQRHGALFVDMDSIFAAQSPDGIVGAELVCDHLHPNPRGYALMARAFCDAIETMKVVPSAPVPAAHEALPRGVTDLDWDIGLLKVYPIVCAWPFRYPGEAAPAFHPFGDTAATPLAREYLNGRLSWTRAHQLMAEDYLRRGNEPSARGEYLALAVFSPDDPWPWRMMAESFKRESKWDLRAAALAECLRRPGQHGMVAYELALTCQRLNDRQGAVNAMSIAARAPEFSREQRKNAEFFLAGFLSDDGRTGEAVEILTSLLREDPGFVPAREFLMRLRSQTARTQQLK